MTMNFGNLVVPRARETVVFLCRFTVQAGRNIAVYEETVSFFVLLGRSSFRRPSKHVSWNAPGTES